MGAGPALPAVFDGCLCLVVMLSSPPPLHICASRRAQDHGETVGTSIFPPDSSFRLRPDPSARPPSELLFYSTSLAMSFRFLWRYPWMHDYAEMWTVGEQEEVQLELKFMYLFEISWYVAGMAYMVLDVPNRKKDFAEMMLHHGITAILTTFSYKIGHLRCGFVIILLHNVADPPLHLAKCLNYVCKRLGLQVRSRL